MDVKKEKLLKRFLLISVSLHLLTILFFFAKRYYYTQYYQSKTQIDLGKKIQMQDRAALYKAIPNEKDEIIFVGNSIIFYFPIAEFFQNSKIKNRGIGFNRTEDILERLDEITESKPKKIFLMIGINDLQSGMAVKDIFSNFQKIINSIKSNSPATKLFTMSILPTAEKGRILNIEELNNLYHSYCKNNQIQFIDLYPHFKKDDAIDPALTLEGLHLNNKGYVLFKKLIENYVEEK